MDFAKSNAPFEHISDFHSKQIVYTKERGWLLVDWRAFHVKARSISALTPFNDPGIGAISPKMPVGIYPRVLNAIYAERGRPGSFFSSLATFCVAPFSYFATHRK